MQCSRRCGIESKALHGRCNETRAASDGEYLSSCPRATHAAAYVPVIVLVLSDSGLLVWIAQADSSTADRKHNNNR
jgi:hypothetical protein